MEKIISLSLLLLITAAFAHETIIVNPPRDCYEENWVLTDHNQKTIESGQQQITLTISVDNNYTGLPNDGINLHDSMRQIVSEHIDAGSLKIYRLSAGNVVTLERDYGQYGGHYTSHTQSSGKYKICYS